MYQRCLSIRMYYAMAYHALGVLRTRYNHAMPAMLLSIQYESIVRRALEEDLEHGDVTTSLLDNVRENVEGRFIAKQGGILCGTEVAASCFTLLDPAATVHFRRMDGTEVNEGDVLGTAHASVGTMLAAERAALNFLQRMSGIATQARNFAKIAEASGIRVVETRKTAPGLRVLEKYAVQTGGGHTHRTDLGQCIMLKDNHFALSRKSPAELVKHACGMASHSARVIAEAVSVEMALEVVEAGAHVVLLDNFSPPDVKKAIDAIGGRAVVEVSGGINESNINDYLIEGVDVLSIGALTHSARPLDISLEI